MLYPWDAKVTRTQNYLTALPLAIVLAMASSAPRAEITIYKCVDDDGHIEFKEKPVGACKALDPPKVDKSASSRSVRIGMTAAQATKAWGEPLSVNRTTTAGGTTEQWVYGISTCLYFRNGKIDAIQNKD